MKVPITCAQCGGIAYKEAGGVNRAKRRGDNLYCGRKCAGLGRRTNKTADEKKEAKRIYDQAYRKANRDRLKAEKAAYFQRTYDPVKAAIERKRRMPRHVEYCRRPEYKVYKRKYDRDYRARKFYGEFAECFVLTMEIRDECLRLQSDYEIRLEKGTLGKTQKRRRDYDRANRQEPEIGPLGHLDRRQGRQNVSLSS